MLRKLIEKETAAVQGVVHTLREWVHPTVVMKRHEFECPQDDLGRDVEEAEAAARVTPPPAP